MERSLKRSNMPLLQLPNHTLFIFICDCSSFLGLFFARWVRLATVHGEFERRTVFLGNLGMLGSFFRLYTSLDDQSKTINHLRENFADFLNTWYFTVEIEYILVFTDIKSRNRDTVVRRTLIQTVIRVFNMLV
jgi:hypothetical protein